MIYTDSVPASGTSGKYALNYSQVKVNYSRQPLSETQLKHTLQILLNMEFNFLSYALFGMIIILPHLILSLLHLHFVYLHILPSISAFSGLNNLRMVPINFKFNLKLIALSRILTILLLSILANSIQTLVQAPSAAQNTPSTDK